jgi:hypothetical protein
MKQEVLEASILSSARLHNSSVCWCITVTPYECSCPQQSGYTDCLPPNINGATPCLGPIQNVGLVPSCADYVSCRLLRWCCAKHSNLVTAVPCCLSLLYPYSSEMGAICSMHVGDEKCIVNFSQETCCKETTWET